MRCTPCTGRAACGCGVGDDSDAAWSADSATAPGIAELEDAGALDDSILLVCDRHVGLIDPNVFTDRDGRHFLWQPRAGRS